MENLIPVELLKRFGIDESVAMVVAIGIVVLLLFIMMVVIIASMRVKFYKDKLTNIAIDNSEKDDFIST